MRYLVLCALAIVAASVAGCGGSQGSSSTTTTPGSSTTPVPDAKARTPTGHGRTAAWPTYHRVLARTGAASAGPALGKARQQWTSSVDGAVYAEPLVAEGKVIVATENDSVYAFDAGTGRQDWRAHLGTPVPGGDLPCGNIDPSGITGTPVIDGRNGTVYVVAFQPTEHRLFALDLATGHVRWQRRIDPPRADPRTHQQRAALALSRGHVYVAYGGLFGDCGQYHGWVLGAPASGPTGKVLVYRVPTGREGAIWAPSGPAVDHRGNVYVATGNGSSTSGFDFGNAVIRLTPTLHETGFFAPSNWSSMSAADQDLGSTGPLLLPGGRVFIVGKTGVGYLLSANRLGGIGHPVASHGLCGAAFGGNAYAGGTIYVPCTDGIAAVRVAGDRLQPAWRQSAATYPPILAGNGLWAIGGRTLYQLDPHTGRVRFSAPIGDPASFATPAAGDGRIFVAAGSRVYSFG